MTLEHEVRVLRHRLDTTQKLLSQLVQQVAQISPNKRLKHQLYDGSDIQDPPDNWRPSREQVQAWAIREVLPSARQNAGHRSPTKDAHAQWREDNLDYPHPDPTEN
jgi:hypothetical protein